MGILANAPLMAVKGLGSPGWQLHFQITLSSIGMFLVLYLGSRMATRPKLPFVLVPGYATAAVVLAMAFAWDPLVFLILLGLSVMLETVTRPAVSAVIRLNYPVTHRGAATGEIRKWFTLTFMATSLASSLALRWFEDAVQPMIRGQMLAAAGAYLAAYLVFRRIRVREPADRAPVDGEPVDGEPADLAPADRSTRGDEPAPAPSLSSGEATVGETLRRIRADRRFVRYLLIGFLYAFGALVYAAFIPAFLMDSCGYGYVATALLVTIVPGIVAFGVTGVIGRWIDRVSVWRAWTWIRLGWGLDPLILAVTAPAALLYPPLLFVVPVLARTSRGVVQGGSWILWWQIGVNHFAPTEQDTSRYMGALIFMNGVARLAAPLAGAWIYHRCSAEAAFVIGGALVMLAALLSAREARREEADPTLATMADFEQRHLDETARPAASLRAAREGGRDNVEERDRAEP
jgi:MFS family permease